MNPAVTSLPTRAWAGLFAAIFLAWAVPARAGTLFVNPTDGDDSYSGHCQTWEGGDCGPKRSIRAAMDAAVDGDEVVLSVGTYLGDGNRDLDFAGKAITVRSANPFDPNVVSATVIDCEGSAQARHRAFRLSSGESLTSAIRGLKIVGGVAPEDTDFPPDGLLPAGGAILCDGASPSIERCIIASCRALLGGGIFARSADLTILACHFEDNSTASYKNRFEGGGGAIDCIDCQIEISDSSFIDCRAHIGGGAIGFTAGSARITQCEFEANVAESDIFRAVGGAILGDQYDQLFIDRCSFSRNQTMHNDGRGGALVGVGNSTILSNSRFHSNRSTKARGAVRLGGAASEISGCTFADNSSPSVFRVSGVVAISNSIFWNNDEPAIPANVSVNYSIVQGGKAGEGNLDSDPLFVDLSDGNLRLLESSPAINSGDPEFSSPPGLLDLDGNRRLWSTTIDMGSYEYGSFQYADVNCDGATDFSDIDAFVIALIDRELFTSRFPTCDWFNADTNTDGTVSFSDIDTFILLISDN